MSWSDLAQTNQELAEFGRNRFASEVAFLATLRKDGSPRVHPVTPIIGDERPFVFMEPTSPKSHDLRRDSRYALYCSVADSAGYEIVDRYVLFELEVDAAFSTVYADDGESIRDRWKREG